MSRQIFRPTSYPGILHRYHPRLTAFEFDTEALRKTRYPPTLLFVAGLGDAILTVPYVQDLLKLGWAVVQVDLTSSNDGWGRGSIDRDAKEISKCISYFKHIGRPKVVLMGHSTGCQDTMHYLCKLDPEHQADGGLDGAILQAPVSDREALVISMGKDKWDRSWRAAKKMMDDGKGDDIISPKLIDSIFSASPVTAKRWYSLSSPHHDTQDDFFSSDLPQSHLQSTFGSISPNSTPLLILYSGSDEFVPKTVNKQALVQRWIDVCTQNKVAVDVNNSGVIPGATHNLDKVAPEVKEDFKWRVKEFLLLVERDGSFIGVSSHM